MGAGVPVCVLGLIVLPLVQLDGSIGGYGAVELCYLVIHTAGQHILCQSLADAFSNLITGYAAFIFAYGTVGKRNLYHVVL